MQQLSRPSYKKGLPGGKVPTEKPEVSSLHSSPPASLLHLGRNQNGTFMLITTEEKTDASVHFPNKSFSAPFQALLL